MNPKEGHFSTASWAPQRGPQIIRRPTGPGFRTVEVDMAQIRWAEARVHAYEEGVGDIESYNRARTLLEETGWWGMAGPSTPLFAQPATLFRPATIGDASVL